MSTLYKLTTQDHKTRKGAYNECQWGEGVSHSGKGVGDLCGDGYIHAYTHPLLAVLLNPIHAAIVNPVLWECAGDVVLSDNGLKVGCVTLTTVRRVPLPEVTTTQRVAFGILCAKAVYEEAAWDEWAGGWLNGTNRSARAASRAAAGVSRAAADAAAKAQNGKVLDLGSMAERAVEVVL